MVGTASAAPASSPWEQPASTLAEEIAGLLGPGQAHLTLRNLSTIPVGEIPAIRRLLVQDLKAHDVLASGTESANQLRVTLSENVRERLWVAEVIEGSETRVAMVHVDAGQASASLVQERMVLRKERYPIAHGLSGSIFDPIADPVLAMLETRTNLLILRQSEVMVLGFGEAGWIELTELEIAHRSSSTRDPRGMILPAADGNGFTAFTAGSQCTGSFASLEDSNAHRGDGWTINCQASDDPWPIPQTDSAIGPAKISAFYNANRNFFTGVLTPSLGVDLPLFYSSAWLARPSGAALLVNGIDGKVLLVENEALKPISGTRDWGSDFAALHSGCGAGTQIVASGSGEAPSDSLRAYELPAQEAVPVSAALAMDGTVTALWAAPDGKSLFAVVRITNASSPDQYEVDRVTATCN
jgi:hypothetical protein